MSKWIEFGKLLRSRREAAGLSRSRVARLAGLSEATLKKLERGQMASERTLLDLYSVHELGWRKGDFPVSVDHKFLDEFQRFQLRYLVLRSSEHAFHEVLKWAGIQTQTAEIRALDEWAKQRLSVVEDQLHLLREKPTTQLEGENNEPNDRQCAQASKEDQKAALSAARIVAE
jgi:transcriptional regulator with XRE-family HTH domain